MQIFSRNVIDQLTYYIHCVVLQMLIFSFSFNSMEWKSVEFFSFFLKKNYYYRNEYILNIIKKENTIFQNKLDVFVKRDLVDAMREKYLCN